MNREKFMDAIVDVLAKALGPLITKITALEQRQPERGEKGEVGSKGLDGEKGAAGERGEPGAQGKDGLDGVDGKDGAPGRDGERGASGVDGAAGKDGAQGADGVNGKDGLPGERGADGKDGLAGERGADGKSLTVEDVYDWLEANFSKWALAAERRVYELGEKAVAAMPKAKDGADGLRVDDFELVGRMMTLKHGDKILKQVRLAFPVYHGVFEAETTYDADDMVTFGGSVWSAIAETKSKPGTDDTWKLAVKKGRDGRDARTPA